MALATWMPHDRELLKFKESISTPGVPAVAIVNPDGSNIGGAGGGTFPYS